MKVWSGFKPFDSIEGTGNLVHSQNELELITICFQWPQKWFFANWYKKSSVLRHAGRET